MEKFGVVIDKSSEKVKTASTQGKCPACGDTLNTFSVNNLPHCPNCGTKPFEKQP